MSMYGQYIGYPDVYPWSKLFPVSIVAPAGGTASEINLWDELGESTRGFILSDAVVLDCVPWGHADQDTYVAIGFPPGAYFGTLRKIKTKGTGGNTAGDPTVITFFA